MMRLLKVRFGFGPTIKGKIGYRKRKIMRPLEKMRKVNSIE